MLTITIPAAEYYNYVTDEIISTKLQTLQLEHSLVSLSKWEAEWHKPFLTKVGLSDAEFSSYIKHMTLTQNVDPNVYLKIPKPQLAQVRAYMEDTMTATTFYDSKKTKGSNEIITSELIYYWLVAYNIPFDCQKWHLNRLFTLIRVCDLKNNPGKKMSQKEILSRNRDLNASRRQALKTKG